MTSLRRVLLVWPLLAIGCTDDQTSVRPLTAKESASANMDGFWLAEGEACQGGLQINGDSAVFHNFANAEKQSVSYRKINEDGFVILPGDRETSSPVQGMRNRNTDTFLLKVGGVTALLQRTPSYSPGIILDQWFEPEVQAQSEYVSGSTYRKSDADNHAIDIDHQQKRFSDTRDMAALYRFQYGLFLRHIPSGESYAYCLTHADDESHMFAGVEDCSRSLVRFAG